MLQLMNLFTMPLNFAILGFHFSREPCDFLILLTQSGILVRDLGSFLSQLLPQAHYCCLLVGSRPKDDLILAILCIYSLGSM